MCGSRGGVGVDNNMGCCWTVGVFTFSPTIPGIVQGGTSLALAIGFAVLAGIGAEVAPPT